MAAGALHALRRSGRRVPDDVAVIGFDDLPLAQHTQPPLTTIRQPLERVGAAAAQRLLAELDGVGDVLDPVLPTTLVAARLRLTAPISRRSPAADCGLDNNDAVPPFGSIATEPNGVTTR